MEFVWDRRNLDNGRRTMNWKQTGEKAMSWMVTEQLIRIQLKAAILCQTHQSFASIAIVRVFFVLLLRFFDYCFFSYNGAPEWQGGWEVVWLALCAAPLFVGLGIGLVGNLLSHRATDRCICQNESGLLILLLLQFA